VALVTESGAQLSGWNIDGSVILGGAVATAAQSTVIRGSLTVGANTPNSRTTIQQGGAEVIVPDKRDQILLPGVCDAPPAVPSSPSSATVRFSRYR